MTFDWVFIINKHLLEKQEIECSRPKLTLFTEKLTLVRISPKTHYVYTSIQNYYVSLMKPFQLRNLFFLSLFGYRIFTKIQIMHTYYYKYGMLKFYVYIIMKERRKIESDRKQCHRSYDILFLR